MGRRRRRIALVCLAVLFCMAGILLPGSRTFASNLAAKLGHLRPAPRGSLAKVGPIPFILNPTAKRPATHAASGKTHQPKTRKDAKAKASTSKPPAPAVNPLPRDKQ